jgi:hypothetical protein
MFSELLGALGEEDDQVVLDDIRRLLRELRRRKDVTYAIAKQIDAALTEEASYRTDPIFSTQPNEHATHRTDLPDPLPEAPLIPDEYLERVSAQVHDHAMLAPPVQAQLLFELRNALHEEDSPTVVDDIWKLLSALRRRTDVTYPVATEIDSMLGEGAPDSAGPEDSEVPRAATVPATDAIFSGEGVPLFQRLKRRMKTRVPPY